MGAATAPRTSRIVSDDVATAACDTGRELLDGKGNEISGRKEMAGRERRGNFKGRCTSTGSARHASYTAACPMLGPRTLRAHNSSPSISIVVTPFVSPGGSCKRLITNIDED